MDTKVKYINLKTGIVLLAILLLTRLADQLPWWIFIVPVLITGIVITWRKWPVNCFWVGFLSGFIAWTSASIYFHLRSDGRLLDRFGILAGMIIVAGSGLVGGLMTGLALYTGKSITTNREAHLTL
ncbi:hypothetical protein SIO70_28570 [Chitinophaga sancti]|uniref:hypothetical protein n=1 Tax=Chitinophaga sancti TaxID=1004 RepID=UPI002A747AC1|nr:hypothetical protein [Chitinophaga sancti]WPQ62318.1 hypothetical protein SIO70_28570 [Chitinophaga sancti]